MKKIIIGVILILTTTIYSQENKELNNLTGKVYIGGIIGATYIYKGIGFSVDGNYVFSKKWGISLGYSGSIYDTTGTYGSIKQTHTIYLNILYNINIIENLDIYIGLGPSYIFTEIKGFNDDFDLVWKKQNRIFVYSQAGLQYWISNKFAIKLSFLPYVGGGVNIVF